MKAERLAGRWLVLATALAWVLLDPALAGNKFETISHGVSGTRSLKVDHLALGLFVVGGIFILGAVLSVLVPHKNALFLNYATWKQSAVLFLLLGTLAVGAGLALQ